jgi:hypothetical protein
MRTQWCILSLGSLLVGRLALSSLLLNMPFQITQDDFQSVVLLGAESQYPEVEYGWIEPGAKLAAHPGDGSRVIHLWEKPSLEVAQELLPRPVVHTFKRATICWPSTRQGLTWDSFRRSLECA